MESGGENPLGMLTYVYRPQRSCGKVMFLHSVHRGGVAEPPGTDTLRGADTPPPWEQQTPPWEQQTPPLGADPPEADTPLRRACWEIRATRGQYTSYWNAYLFFANFVQKKHEIENNLVSIGGGRGGERRAP